MIATEVFPPTAEEGARPFLALANRLVEHASEAEQREGCVRAFRRLEAFADVLEYLPQTVGQVTDADRRCMRANVLQIKQHGTQTDLLRVGASTDQLGELLVEVIRGRHRRCRSGRVGCTSALPRRAQFDPTILIPDRSHSWLRTKIYEDLGWMPYLRQGSALIQQRKNEHLGKVSDRDVGDLENCPTTVLIEPETSLWCLASEITRGRVIFQVFGDNIQLLEEACERLVIDLPVAAEAHGISQLRFSPRIQVREDRSALMSAVGRISQLELLTFFQFLSRRRRKEQAVLLSSFVLAAILGVSSYWSPRILWLDTHAGYWHGLLDRIGSALVVATIILLLNPFIDWRATRRPSNAIDWSIAS